MKNFVAILALLVFGNIAVAQQPNCPDGKCPLKKTPTVVPYAAPQVQQYRVQQSNNYTYSTSSSSCPCVTQRKGFLRRLFGR